VLTAKPFVPPAAVFDSTPSTDTQVSQSSQVVAGLVA
jgi:hypothetical protein